MYVWRVCTNGFDETRIPVNIGHTFTRLLVHLFNTLHVCLHLINGILFNPLYLFLGLPRLTNSMASPEHVRQTSVSWEAGVVEELQSYKLKEGTIRIMKEEEFCSFEALDMLDNAEVDMWRQKYKLPGAQCKFLKTMIEDRKMKKAAALVEKNPEYPDTNITEKQLMTEDHKDILRSECANLCNLIKPTEVLTHLFSQCCLTEQDLELCRSQHTSRDTVFEMLYRVRRGSEKCFWELVKGLYKSRQGHAARLLDKTKNNDEPKPTDVNRPG